MKSPYVYILECSDGSYYTGVTTELDIRVLQHQTGAYKNSYTSSRLPVKLVFYHEFSDINQAIEVEKQIKKWSRAKKLALIEDRYEDLPNLAKKKF